MQQEDSYLSSYVAPVILPELCVYVFSTMTSIRNISYLILSYVPAILMLTTSTNLLLSITIRVMVSVTLQEHYYTLIFLFLTLMNCSSPTSGVVCFFPNFLAFFPEPHEKKNKYCRNCQCPPESLFHHHEALNTKAADYWRLKRASLILIVYYFVKMSEKKPYLSIALWWKCVSLLQQVISK